MSVFHSLSVKARLVLLVAVALAATLGMAAIGVFGVRQATDAAATVIARHMTAVGLIGDLRADAGNLRRYEKDTFLNTGNPARIESYLPKWRASLQHARQNAAALEGVVDADGRTLITAVRRALDNYAGGFEGVAARMMRGEFADAGYANAAMEPLKADIRQIDEKLVALTQHVDAAAAAEKQRLADMQQRVLAFQGAIVVSLAVLLGLIAWVLVRSIMGPLRRANDALERLAAGDLAQQLHAGGRDELAQMIRRLADTQAALQGLVRAIQGDADSVATASLEIARGNADLSARTERQAASLQQTAASMEQLTATVNTGADTARQANTLAQAASESARQGGDAVAEVVRTMAGILEASQRIADITVMIDGIAFQTNILALNAAVEAARAGEQGRGFAVVASEVRALAGRSGEAAREIKALIGRSVERVQAGHQLVLRAGSTMDQVVQQVRNVSGLVGDISAAVGEQRDGIEVVSQAVTQLDRATQQNAALVQQSADASVRLREKADGLRAAVGVFRLSAP